MRVMARARTTRSPARTPSTYCWSDSRRPPALAAGGVLGTNIARQRVQDHLRANWDHGSGAKYSGHARLLEIIIVLRRDYSAGVDQNVAAPAPFQLGDYFRHQRLVSAREGRGSQHVDIVFDGHGRGFGRRLEERTHVDIEAEIGEGSGDNL